MRTIVLAAVALAALVLAACGDDDPPTPAGPTALTLEKSVVTEGANEFTFTVRLSNDGANAATNVVLSDVWDDGITVTSIGDFDGHSAEDIGDAGWEVLIDEFAAGESGEIVYRGTCNRSGQWMNNAVVTSANSDPDDMAISVVCP